MQNDNQALDSGVQLQSSINVLKVQSIQGIDSYPEGGVGGITFWKYWYDSYTRNGVSDNNSGLWWGIGNKIMSNINGVWSSFVPTGGTINLYPSYK